MRSSLFKQRESAHSSGVSVCRLGSSLVKPAAKVLGWIGRLDATMAPSRNEGDARAAALLQSAHCRRALAWNIMKGQGHGWYRADVFGCCCDVALESLSTCGLCLETLKKN